ncbi:hypothetical protein ES703_76639 [subsurface metagenome]
MPGEVFSRDTKGAKEAREGRMNDLGKIIKQQRLMTPLTLKELAAASGVSASHIGRMERGERLPSARILQKIAKPLGFEVEQLLTLAGYLSPQASTTESEIVTGKLDPYVASVLAQELVETQRAVIGIFSILKSIARGSGSNIGFAEYIHRNYPQLDEDIITMIEDIINRESAKEANKEAAEAPEKKVGESSPK